MTLEYSIQLATPAHVALLPGIERSAASLFAEILPPALLDATTPLPVLAAAQHAGRLWVAIDGAGVAVGFALVELVDRGVHLLELDVSPEHQRRGIGTRLIEAVEGWAASHRLAEITLTTYRDIPWNAPVYRRMGFDFVPAAELDEHLRAHLDREAASGFGVSARVAMRKRLTAA